MCSAKRVQYSLLSTHPHEPDLPPPYLYLAALIITLTPSLHPYFPRLMQFVPPHFQFVPLPFFSSFQVRFFQVSENELEDLRERFRAGQYNIDIEHKSFSMGEYNQMLAGTLMADVGEMATAFGGWRQTANAAPAGH